MRRSPVPNDSHWFYAALILLLMIAAVVFGFITGVF